MKGTIFYWSKSMGYGIVKYGSNKAFVHVSNCNENQYVVGDTIEFDLDLNIALRVSKVPTTPKRRPKANANTP